MGSFVKENNQPGFNPPVRWLGVDTGGTFTDFVLYDGQGLRVHKVLSTPHAPEDIA